jgi:RNA polymerase sigma-70 factor, ECF subfamily
VRAVSEGPAADRPSPTDEELMIRYREGDADAFPVIVRRYKDRLTSAVMRLVGDRDKAEDIVQETFLRVHKNAARYKTIARFSTWIYTIALNMAKNEIRNTRRRKTTSLWDIGLDRDGEPTAYEIPDEADRPDDVVERRDLRGLMERCIAQLPPKYRTIIVLRDVEGLSYEEIAQILKLPEGTVKSRMNRARLRFKDLLEPLLS